MNSNIDHAKGGLYIWDIAVGVSGISLEHCTVWPWGEGAGVSTPGKVVLTHLNAPDLETAETLQRWSRLLMSMNHLHLITMVD